ncbi:hypothetical protein [Paenibacillus assamensis]|uniref:hypothetical protein n=1 Tax=Paenibacillus assamensis TaxID=311244 RepID=UPI000425FE57|nr:hypothetical protein [Paenibacillus assamensis]
MRFQCRCGEILSDTLVPNDIELFVYTDREFEKIMDLESIEDIPDPVYSVWKCTNCERILVFDEAIKLIKTYVLEEI